MAKKNRFSIIVSGMIAADPWHGGATWAVLQYVLGLRHLGHEVILIEPIGLDSLRAKGVALGARKNKSSIGSTAVRDTTQGALAGSDNADYFRRVTDRFGLRDQAALLLTGTEQTVGLSYESLRSAARGADALINISGMLTDETLLAPIPVRVYLDLDPAFNQLWSAVQGVDMRYAGHTHFVTIGRNIGDSNCSVPTCGLSWLSTFQPVVLDLWPVAQIDPRYGLTTVANWRGYGSIEYAGVKYGQKAHSLRQFLALPRQTKEEFTLALGIHEEESKDLEGLLNNGWRLLNPADVASTPDQYQRFIHESKAEFGIAKSGYVLSNCGWFSDRSACYLASGRPVIAQETGFSRYLPTGSGLFSFRSESEMLAAIAELERDYSRHRHAAREIAETYFDSNIVLKNLLNVVLS